MNGLFFQRVSGLTSEEFAENMNNGVVYFVKSGNQYVRVESAAEFDANTIYYIQEAPAVSEELKDQILDKISSIGQYNEHAKGVLVSEGVTGITEHTLKDITQDTQNLFVEIDNLVGTPNIAQYTVLEYEMNTSGEYTTPSRTTHPGVSGREISVDTATLSSGFEYDTTYPGYYATGIVNEDNSTVFTVYIKRKQFMVTFDCDGGYIVQDGVQHSTYSVPVYFYADLRPVKRQYSAIKTGYTFTGWTGTDTMPSRDITITALYTINSYTASWYVDDTLYSTSTFEYGATITPPSTSPTKTGYTFTGWSPTPTTMPAENVSFVAQWSADTYNLTVNYVTEDSAAAPPPVTLPVAYNTRYSVTSPDLWGYTPDAATATGIMPASNYTVTVTYYLNTYTVTWLTPSSSTTESVVYKSMPVGVPTPTREGYVFDTWRPAVTAQPPYDITYSAMWIPKNNIQYKIKVYTMDTSGNYDNGTVTTYNNGTSGDFVNAETILPALSRGYYYARPAGYDYMGYINADGSSVFTVFIARYTYTLAFKLEYESEGYVRRYVNYSTNQVYFGATITYPTMPDVDGSGYKFIGWSPSGQATMPPNDLTIIGEYSLLYPIRFYLNGGTASYTWSYTSYDSTNDILTVRGTYDDNVPVITMSKSGYTFAGWDTAPPTTFSELFYESSEDSQSAQLKIYNARWNSVTPVNSTYQVSFAWYFGDQDYEYNKNQMWKTFTATSGTTIDAWDVKLSKTENGTTTYYTIATTDGYVYTGPGMSYGTNGRVTKNRMYQIFGRSDDWIRVGPQQWVWAGMTDDTYGWLFSSGLWMDDTLAVWTSVESGVVREIVSLLHRYYPADSYIFKPEYIESMVVEGVPSVGNILYYTSGTVLSDNSTRIAMPFRPYKVINGEITPLME